MVFWFLCTGFFSSAAVQLTGAESSAPVIIDGTELFLIKARVGELSPADRARIIGERVQQVAEDWNVPVEEINSVSSNNVSIEIIAGQTFVMTVTEGDAQAERLPLPELAKQRELTIKTAVRNYRDMHGTQWLLQQIGKAILLTGVMIWLFSLINKSAVYLRKPIQHEQGLRIYLRKIPGGRWLPVEQVQKLFHYIFLSGTWFLRLVIVYFYLSIVLGLFPWTVIYSRQLLNYIAVILQTAAYAIWDYLPNGLAVLIILVISRLLLRVVRFFFDQIKEEKIKITGFYTEWADSTYKIVRFFILAIAAISIFPYIPGSKSMAFQGVSVFLGVLFSLGSSSAVANVIAGIALTYTRSFGIGDRVRIGEHTGDVMEKSLLATRIRTIKNEDIIIPNTIVFNNPVVNYSTASKETALILHADITLGYDVPWQTAHRLLIEAALATPDILTDPKPFVLQRKLNDVTVGYEINAYTQKPNRMAVLYSGLYQNIIDIFQAAGIQLMTPHYVALQGQVEEGVAEKG